MDLLVQSCKDSSEYPQNLICHDALSHNLKMHHHRLRSQSNRLFDESQAAVDFLDFKDGDKGKALQIMLAQTANEAALWQYFVQAV